MPTYTYRVRKSPGELLTGTMEGESERAISHRLKSMGHHPLSITEEVAGKGIAQEFSLELVRRVRGQDVAVFTRQLSNLIGAGMPLATCLTTLMDQTENPRLIRVIETLRSQIQGGSTFSGALSRHPKIFPPLYVSMVRAGETGGMLEEVLERLANFTEKDQELKGKVKAAMAYPLLLTIVGIATIFVLVSFVIPKFVTMFHDLGQVLPLPTRILIHISGFMSNFWWLVIIFAVIMVLLMKRYTNTGHGKLAIDRLKLRIPILKELICKLEVSKFARTLGTLLQNGVPILTALQIVAKTLGNQEIAEDVITAHKEVSEGVRLQETLRKSSHFSAMVVNMIAIGEESGDLEGMLSKVAQTYDQEVDRAVKAMTSLLEPAMIIILGGCVGFIVMSILLPIFQINVLAR